MLFELQDQPTTTMMGTVISATTRHVVLMLPDWSSEVALYLRHGDPHFPRASAGTQRPAVNVRYECKVDLNGPQPRVISWKDAPKESKLPSPLPAPCGLPGPPEILPILNETALSKVVGSALSAKGKAKQMDAIRYLVRRAHGQGYAEGRRA